MSVFPLHYEPRPYQRELHAAFEKYRYVAGVYPRQSGKDVAASIQEQKEALRTPKTTGVYVSLNNPMIRDILWDKTYLCPHCDQYIRGLQDQTPPELVVWKNTVMEGRYANHSRTKLQGYFQSGQDKSGVGTSFQRYTFTELALFFREDPIPRIWPIVENRAEDKRLRAVSTPRGRRNNPLWKLMETLEGRKDSKILIRTIDDCNEMMRRAGLPPVLTRDELDQISEDYLKRFGNTRMFEQEYYCSFDEVDAAAVYGEAYMKLIAEGRSHDFNLHPGHPVFVMFDIGSSGKHSDATAWIAFQYINGRKLIYDCGEGHGKALPEYVDVLREKHWFHRIAWMILPWDGDHHEKAINTTPADMMRQKFPNVAVLAKSNKVYKIPGSRQGDYDLVTDIQQTRMNLYNTIIHATNCDRLLECLENYKYSYDTKRQIYSDKPVHDQFSHLMDALRYTDQAIKELDFFNGGFFDAPGQRATLSYTDDWAGVWRQ